MKHILFQFFEALFIIGAFQITSFAQMNENGRWKTNLFYEPVEIVHYYYSEMDFANALTKLAAIEFENTRSADEWPGDYLAHGSEVNRIAFRWSPQSGFVLLNFYTCTPELRSLQYGTVTATSDYVWLNSQNLKHRQKPAKYLPVKWGDRHYLVAENKVAQFYKFVAGYGWKPDEYVFFDFLLRAGDAGKTISGMPIFPSGYEQFVRKPIEATITKVIRRQIKTGQNYDGSPAYESQTFVRLNAGSANKVKRGTTLNIWNSENNETIEIVQVGRHFSTGVLVRSLDENKEGNGQRRANG